MAVVTPAKSSLVQKMRIVATRQGADLVISAQVGESRGSYQFGSLHIRAGLIFNFGVNPSFRQYGIGKRLFRAAINRPDLPPRLRLYAKAQPDGMPQDKLEEFYQSFGFRPTGITTQYGKQMHLDRSSTTVVASSV